MPNWCDTHIVFFSENKAELEKLRTLIIENTREYKSYSDGRDYTWIGNACEEYLDISKYNCRGFVEDVSDIYFGDKEYYFDLYQLDAWSYHTLIWRHLIINNFPSVDFVFKAEEPGCEIYVISDISRKYFSELYIVDIQYANESDIICFDNDKELINYFNNLFNEDFSYMRQIENHIDKVIDKDSDEWIYINSYDYINDDN